MYQKRIYCVVEDCGISCVQTGSVEKGDRDEAAEL